VLLDKLVGQAAGDEERAAGVRDAAEAAEEEHAARQLEHARLACDAVARLASSDEYASAKSTAKEAHLRAVRAGAARTLKLVEKAQLAHAQLSEAARKHHAAWLLKSKLQRELDHLHGDVDAATRSLAKATSHAKAVESEAGKKRRALELALVAVGKAEGKAEAARQHARELDAKDRGERVREAEERLAAVEAADAAEARECSRPNADNARTQQAEAELHKKAKLSETAHVASIAVLVPTIALREALAAGWAVHVDVQLLYAHGADGWHGYAPVPVEAERTTQQPAGDAKQRVLLDVDVGGWGRFELRWRWLALRLDRASQSERAASDDEAHAQSRWSGQLTLNHLAPAWEPITAEREQCEQSVSVALGKLGKRVAAAQAALREARFGKGPLRAAAAERAAKLDELDRALDRLLTAARHELAVLRRTCNLGPADQHVQEATAAIYKAETVRYDLASSAGSSNDPTLFKLRVRRLAQEGGFDKYVAELAALAGREAEIARMREHGGSPNLLFEILASGAARNAGLSLRSLGAAAASGIFTSTQEERLHDIVKAATERAHDWRSEADRQREEREDLDYSLDEGLCAGAKVLVRKSEREWVCGTVLKVGRFCKIDFGLKIEDVDDAVAIEKISVVEREVYNRFEARQALTEAREAAEALEEAEAKQRVQEAGEEQRQRWLDKVSAETKRDARLIRMAAAEAEEARLAETRQRAALEAKRADKIKQRADEEAARRAESARAVAAMQKAATRRAESALTTEMPTPCSPPETA
jgi:hypothetical protein